MEPTLAPDEPEKNAARHRYGAYVGGTMVGRMRQLTLSAGSDYHLGVVNLPRK